MVSTWYPAQFITYDGEFSAQVNFKSKMVYLAQFQINGQENKWWVAEEAVFYRLPSPKEGRTTLMFDNVEVE